MNVPSTFGMQKIFSDQCKNLVAQGNYSPNKLEIQSMDYSHKLFKALHAMSFFTR